MSVKSFKPLEEALNLVAAEHSRESVFELKPLYAPFPLPVQKHGIGVYKRHHRVNKIKRIVRCPSERPCLNDQSTHETRCQVQRRAGAPHDRVLAVHLLWGELLPLFNMLCHR
jgi:hypothetical protein